MSEFIKVPITNKFEMNEQIGTLEILKSALPKEPNFVFSIGYKVTEVSGDWELKCVALIPDEEFARYLKQENN